MKDTCTTCGHWKGLHRWNTMQCPANGHEDGQFRQTTYTEESDDLAALRAERDELREALEAILTSAEYMRDRRMPYPAGVDRARAVLAKYQEAK